MLKREISAVKNIQLKCGETNVHLPAAIPERRSGERNKKVRGDWSGTDCKVEHRWTDLLVYWCLFYGGKLTGSVTDGKYFGFGLCHLRQSNVNVKIYSRIGF